MNENVNDKELVSKTSGFGKSLEGEQKWPPVMYRIPVRIENVEVIDGIVLIHNETNIP